MNLLERYIFKRTFFAFLFGLSALCGVVWLTQALRDLDLMTSKGQTLGIFFTMTSLVLPLLIMVLAPFALMIAVIYCLNALNSDSELVVINASGASMKTVMKPILALGLIVTLAGGFLSLYMTPLSLITLRHYITQVRADLVANIVKEGLFTEIEDGMVFHISGRGPNGALLGLFMTDDRDPEQKFVYLAQRAHILKTTEGTFLIMEDGTIQRQIVENNNISLIDFKSYAIDLSELAAREATSLAKPRERPISYFFNPDPDDPYFTQYTGRVRAEFHDRFSNPFYGLGFASICLLFLGRAQTTRQGRSIAIGSAIAGCILLRILGFTATSLTNSSATAIPAMYIVPLAGILIPLVLLTSGWQPKIPKSWAFAIEIISNRMRKYFTKTGFTPAP